MKIKQLHQESTQSLRAQLTEHQQELAKLYVDQRTKDLKKNHQFGIHKTAIARIKTVLRLKELESKGASNG